ncbi:MAG: DUF2589 domain-containing protein [Aureispira sp.]
MESGLVSIANQFSGISMDALIGGPLNAAAEANAKMALTQTKFLLDTCFQKMKFDKREAVQGNIEERDGEGNIIKKAVVASDAVEAYEGYAPIMIKMSLTRAVVQEGTPAIPARTGSDGKDIAAQEATPPTVKNFVTAFDLPLLTIVPLNSLAVDEVDIKFEMEVKSSFAEDKTESKEKELKAAASFEAKVGYGCFSASVKGSASYSEKDSSSHNKHYEKSNSAKYTVAVHASQLPLPKGVNVIIDTFAKSIDPIVFEGKPTAVAPVTENE